MLIPRQIARLPDLGGRRAAAIVAVAVVVPRWIVLLVERDSILGEYVEKSDTFARTLLSSGTFGFLPDVPSAYTQPLYAWFLAGVYGPFGRSWVALGIAQTLLALATALVVLAIGRRLGGAWVGLLAAVLAAVHPYLIWHDVHVNREILDGLLLALLVWCALVAHDRRSLPLGLLTGALGGLAILGNARLVLLPVALAPFVVWRIRPLTRAALGAILVITTAVVVAAPWAMRNRVQLGCFTVTTDTRALWKANNEHTRATLARGQWIDDVPELPGAPIWPERAAELGEETARSVDECAQARFYRTLVLDFWRDEPGEKALLAVQASGMLWRPTFTTETADKAGGPVAAAARRIPEPIYMVALYLLAALGAIKAPRRLLALSGLMLGYNTLAAMAFAGTVRYRVPWDFLLALLAAFAIARIVARVAHRPRRGPDGWG